MAKYIKVVCCLISAVFAVIVVVFLLSGIKKPQPIELEEIGWNFENPLRLEPLTGNYQNRLFDLTLKYVLAPDNCTNSDLLGIFIVTSYYGNVETRSAMRRAFSREDLAALKLRRVFLLGEAPGDAYVSRGSIRDESERFGDILQGNFVEAYRNLTYKHVMGLKWASESCNRAKYVIKMDDDIVVDVRKVARLLESNNFPPNLVAGYILKRMVPIREPANKWYVTEEEYGFPKYPPFVSGWFYVTTPQICAKFFLLSHYVDYFWIDDVYVTGILARRLRIRHYNLGRYFAVHPEFLQCCINDVRKQLDCDVLVAPNGGDSNLFYEFNEAMTLCAPGRCNARTKSLNETCVAERRINVGRGKGIIENYKLRR